ncbi:hypothetical protein BBP40_011127 [Aspergillus hancockii]|nr:hypothetical protein BBP40_011127 [Aspergillus hancockii]
MLFFGVLIDRVGRKTGVIAATLFLALGIALAAAAYGTSELGYDVWMMIVARGVAGFGAGGEYPVCATSATEVADETANLRKRARLFSCSNYRFCCESGIVALIVLAYYSQEARAGVWRISFGLGFVLPLYICFFRIGMINSTQYQKHSIKFNPRMVLPGCLLGGLLMDKIGRKQNMTLGFMIWSIWGFILGGALHPIQSVFPLFVVIILSYSTPLRGHFLGLAAAVGKAGASSGTEVFTSIQYSFDSTAKGQQAVFLIASAFTVFGGLFSWFMIPDMSRELETAEDARFKAYLEENEYELSHNGKVLLADRKSGL